MTTIPFSRLSLAVQWSPTPLDGAVRWAQRVEDAGFEGIWCGDLLHDPFAVLSSYASVTSKLQLGTGIAGWTRTPVAMAITAATVDELSDGRFRLGLGTLPQSYNQDWHGIDTSRLVRRMREYIEAIRAVWSAHSGRKIDYEGEIFQIHGYSRLVRPLRERIPIFLGVSLPQMTRLAGRVADGVFFHPIHTLRYLREVALPNLEQGARQAGRSVRDIEISPSLICSISGDRREALHWAKAHICFYVHQPFLHSVFDLHGVREARLLAAEKIAAGDVAGAIDSLPDEIADLIAVAGTPDDVRRKLADYSDFASLPRLLTVRQNVPADYVQATYDSIIETLGR